MYRPISVSAEYPISLIPYLKSQSPISKTALLKRCLRREHIGGADFATPGVLVEVGVFPQRRNLVH